MAVSELFAQYYDVVAEPLDLTHPGQATRERTVGVLLDCAFIPRTVEHVGTVGLRFAYSHNHVSHNHLRDSIPPTVRTDLPINVTHRGIEYDLYSTGFEIDAAVGYPEAFVAVRPPSFYISDMEGYQRLSMILSLAMGEAIMSTFNIPRIDSTYRFEVSRNTARPADFNHPAMLLDQHVTRHLHIL
jgi:hypothetical protein